MTTFNLPDLGEGLAEAEIVRWHVNVGDAVTVDQPMLAVETAKAVVEVPAPFSGIVKTLYGQPGDVIATGAPLIDFDTSAARSASADTGTVVGNMPTSDTELIETAHAGSSTYNRTNGGTSSSVDTNSAGGPNSTGARLRAAPAARALAKRLGVDLTGLNGSGRGGVIIVDDVIAHSSLATHSSAIARSNTTPGAPSPTTASPSFPGGEKLRGLRRAMSQSMSLARDNVTNCTVCDDADLHRWGEGQDITTRLLRAIATGCHAEPTLNAWFDGNTQSRRLMPRVDVGMAVDTGDGLIVPVIRDVGSRTKAELRQDIDRLKRAARDRTVTPEDLRDVTFMLSNFGMIAGRYATPVVVPPMVAILGSGRLSRDVIAVNDGIEAHLRMPLSLTFDHRCVTGGEAARFLAAVLRDLEKDT
ncbi:MAG: 2-oxo acid dehydrogenase subunit [Gammaproteobacteria bacterium]|nr:2-oxo acid dehydrogenase subunit [Gammaproteobacteria bacterium]